MAYIWWFDKCHTKLGQSSDKEGGGDIFFLLRIGWGFYGKNEITGGRTKLSNGAVSPLKNICQGP